MTNYKKPDPPKDEIVRIIKRNDLSELMEYQIRYGVGTPTLYNLNWHIKCWIQANIDATSSNVHTTWWCKRIMLLDAILKHQNKNDQVKPNYNLPTVYQQLKEIV